MTTLAQDPKTVARRALEEVCARGDFERARELYSPSFRDHVGTLEFHGLEGVRQSVTMYRSIFPDLEIEVADQIVEGDRVASRWIARGTNRGRSATLHGITISRIEDGKIAEDWSHADGLGLLRQLGAWRIAALVAGQARDRLRKRSSAP